MLPTSFAKRRSYLFPLVGKSRPQNDDLDDKQTPLILKKVDGCDEDDESISAHSQQQLLLEDEGVHAGSPPHSRIVLLGCGDCGKSSKFKSVSLWEHAFSVI